MINILFIAAMFIGGLPAPSAFANRPAVVHGRSAESSEKYVRTELYFGLNRKGSSEVSEEEFQRFIDDFVTPRFPDGLTILDARGQWRESDSTLTRERSKVLIVIYPRKHRRAAGAKIEEVRAEYKKRFAQSSVMRVDVGKSLKVSF